MSQTFNRTQAIEYFKSRGIEMSGYMMSKLIKTQAIPNRIDPSDNRAVQIRQEDIDAWIANLKPGRPDMGKYDNMDMVMRKLSKSDSQTKYFLFREREPNQDIFHFVIADWGGVQHDMMLSKEDCILLGIIETME